MNLRSRIQRRGLALVVLASLCGSFAACASILGIDELSEAAHDAGTDRNVTSGDAGSDVGTDAGPPCDFSKAFVLREVPGITDLNWVSARVASLSRDETTMYFHGSPEGGPEDLFVATRAARTDRFDHVQALDVLNDPAVRELEPTISGNQLMIVFSRQPSDGITRDLFLAVRSTANEPFNAPVPMASLNDRLAMDGNPFLASATNELWFVSDRNDAGTHMYRARAESGGFTNPTLVPRIDPTSTEETNPVMSLDGKTLFFTSNGAGTLDVFDLWEAHRDRLDQDFTLLRHVDELSSLGARDYPSWISPDGCRLYIHRDGDPKVRVAERPQ